ncbi:MAG: hypothetical protein V4690_03340 [Patescibacteria group bacterium]
MEFLQGVSRGLQFEQRVFGFYDKFEDIPDYRPYDECLEIVMNTPLITETEEGELEVYDPYNPSPRWGYAKKILAAVEKHLPRRILRSRVRSRPAIYLAMGTMLDYWHGVDAFVFWEGADASIDVSLNQKIKGEVTRLDTGMFGMKANVLISLEHISTEEAINNLGRDIVMELKKDRRIRRWKSFPRRKRKRLKNRDLVVI